jgi:hypothetical protein
MSDQHTVNNNVREYNHSNNSLFDANHRKWDGYQIFADNKIEYFKSRAHYNVAEHPNCQA